MRDYVELDISSRVIGHLSSEYPEYHFVCADFAEGLPDALRERRTFDIITVIDVLYHIVDNERAQSAIANIGELLAIDGRLFVMDFLCRHDYRVSKHVIYRARDSYLAEFRGNQLDLVDNELLFHFLVSPITGLRIIDFLSSVAFKLFGWSLRLSSRFATWAAAKNPSTGYADAGPRGFNAERRIAGIRNELRCP